MVRLLGLLLAALCAVLLSPLVEGAWAAPAAVDRSFVVIVHPGGVPRHITRLTLRRVYLGRVTRWPGGRVAVPVNGPPRSPLREAVGRWLFPEGSEAVREHWQRAYYQGRFPPRALASYRAVALFVARVAGSVGYVPADLPHPGTVEVEGLVP
jgi:ABC-type phosphate transport system substrate-binding protein